MLTPEEAKSSTNTFLRQNSFLRRTFLIFYFMLLFLAFILVIIYSYLNPFFFFLLFMISLVVLYMFLFAFLLVSNDRDFLEHWKKEELREIIYSAKSDLVSRYSLPYYAIIIGVFTIMFMSGIWNQEISYLLPSGTEVLMILVTSGSILYNSVRFQHLFFSNFVLFDTYNTRTQMIAMNLNLLAKGLLAFFVWYVLLFGSGTAYVDSHAGKLNKEPMVLLIFLLAASWLPTLLGRFVSSPDREFVREPLEVTYK